MRVPERLWSRSILGLGVVPLFHFVLAGCAAEGSASSALTIRGELSSAERIALPTEGVALVELARARDGRVVAELRLSLAGRQVPVPFEMKVLRSVLEDGVNYLIRGTVAVYGRTRWVSDAVEIQPRPGMIEVGPLVLKPYDPAAFSAPLLCGNRRANVGVGRVGGRDILQLTVGDEHFELYQVVTASGARYEALTDATTSVWFKGQRATLTVRGETYPECVVAQ